jgi:hypothetical protein
LVGFSGSVTLSCSGAPAASTCSPIPASVPVGGPYGSYPVTSMLIVSTTAGASLPPHAPQWRFPPSFLEKLGLPWLMAGLLALALLMSLRRLVGPSHATAGSAWPTRGAALRLALAGILLWVGIWAACGGGVAPAPVRLSTAAGTYTLTVTAVSGSISHTTTVTLTVQ